jgi:hypothetical protein
LEKEERKMLGKSKLRMFILGLVLASFLGGTAMAADEGVPPAGPEKTTVKKHVKHHKAVKKAAKKAHHRHAVHKKARKPKPAAPPVS